MTDRPVPINEHERTCPDCQRVIAAEQRDHEAAPTSAPLSKEHPMSDPTRDRWHHETWPPLTTDKPRSVETGSEPDWTDRRQRDFTRANIERHPDHPFPYRALLPVLDALDRLAALSTTPAPLDVEERRDAFGTIRLALKGARGLALDHDETALDAELGRAIDLLDWLALEGAPHE